MADFNYLAKCRSPFAGCKAGANHPEGSGARLSANARTVIRGNKIEVDIALDVELCT